MTITIDILATGPTKREIVDAAYGECGQVGYEFGQTDEEYAEGLRRLNALMREWEGMGLTLGYQFPEYPAGPYGVGELDERSGIPNDTQEAASLALAMRLAPTLGHVLSPESRGAASTSKRYMLAKYGSPPTMPLAPGTPRGTSQRLHFINETFEDVQPGSS